MKNKLMSGLLAFGLSGFAASACFVQVRVACPNDKAASGVAVWLETVGWTVTDNLGIATWTVTEFGTYRACVDTTTLPAGATLQGASCQNLKVQDDAPPVFTFALGGAFCDTQPNPGPCWLTGGGTIYKTKGVANYSFGGVIYPGCSPSAADGGNWNVVDHNTGLHFQGKTIVVDSCSGVSTKSPKVNVNIIDYHGTGALTGIGGNPDATIDVSFTGRCVDNLESGGGSDLIYLQVRDASNAIVMQIGNSVDDPAVISTGNLQIHTTSCN